MPKPRGTPLAVTALSARCAIAGLPRVLILGVLGILGVSGASLIAGNAHAAAGVEVRYVEPDKFADIGRSSWDRERVLKTLTAYFQKLGETLPDSQTLRLDITDIDLAGEIRPWGSSELRVLRGQADWPQIKLRYVLQEGERTLKSGEARLSDLSYMQALNGPDRAGDELAVEKRMLRRWFADTFTPP